MLYENDRGYAHGNLLLFGFTGLITVLVLLPYWVFSYRIDRHRLFEPIAARPSRAAQAIEGIPPPRLQTHPREEAQRYKEKQQEMLRTYGWTDRNQGLVRIPIDEALKRYEASLRSTQP